MDYVVGFAFNDVQSEFALILKNRPKWQEGLFNGVGGKIEEGETPIEAMAREFVEETGYLVPESDWRPLCSISWANDLDRIGSGEEARVHFFKAIIPVRSLKHVLQTMTDEPISVWGVHDIDLFGHRLVPNLQWLLPLAMYSADIYDRFDVRATVATKL